MRLAGWRRKSKLPGRPDFVFPKRKVAVFVDGDFWHGNPKKFRIPKSNCDYWERKILGNRMRDRKINKDLKQLGWPSSASGNPLLAMKRRLWLSCDSFYERATNCDAPHAAPPPADEISNPTSQVTNRPIENRSITKGPAAKAPTCK